MPFSTLYTLEIEGGQRTVCVVTPEYRPNRVRSAHGDTCVVDVKDIDSGVYFYGIQRSDLQPKPTDN